MRVLHTYRCIMNPHGIMGKNLKSVIVSNLRASFVFFLNKRQVELSCFSSVLLFFRAFSLKVLFYQNKTCRKYY